MKGYEGLDPSLARRANLGIATRAGSMYARGVLRRWTLGESRGPLFIGRGVRIKNPGFIRALGRLVIEDEAEIQGISRGGITFGADVSIGPRVSIRPSSYYGGPAGEGLSVGDRSSFATGCFVGASGTIEIGSDVMFGPGVRIFSENHVFSRRDVTIKSQGVERGLVRVGDDCWIASGVTIASGVEIGRGVVIGAGSVVTKSIPSFTVAAGSPAKVIRDRA